MKMIDSEKVKSDLISAFSGFNSALGNYNMAQHIIEMIINRQEEIIVEPSIHAHCVVDWLGDCHCSNCGESIDYKSKYCNWCGAKLDEPEERE